MGPTKPPNEHHKHDSNGLSRLRFLQLISLAFLSDPVLSFVPSKPRSLISMRRRAPTCSVLNEGVYEVVLNKPFGLTIEQIKNVTAVLEVRGNAEKAGVCAGDALIGLESFFGDAMWGVPSGENAVDDIETHLGFCGGRVRLRFEKSGWTKLKDIFDPSNLNSQPIVTDDTTKQEWAELYSRFMPPSGDYPDLVDDAEEETPESSLSEEEIMSMIEKMAADE